MLSNSQHLRCGFNGLFLALYKMEIKYYFHSSASVKGRTEEKENQPLDTLGLELEIWNTCGACF